MAKPLTLGGLRFSKKADAKAHIQGILRAPSLGALVDPEHEPVLTDLLGRHPDAEEKIGAGVLAFKVDRDGWGGRCFYVIRFDGTAVDFSYLACLDGAPSQRQLVLAALRHAVKEQVRAERDMHVGGVCSVTGKTLTSRDAFEMHHAEISFDELANGWAAAERVQMEDLALRDTEGALYVLADPRLEQSWCDYHSLLACLRPVTKEAHKLLTKGAQK